MERGKRGSCCLKRRPRIVPYASLLRCRDKDVIEIVNLANVLFRKIILEVKHVPPTFNPHSMAIYNIWSTNKSFWIASPLFR
jgi:hypothetical protein